jgi:hypothetical protein
MRVSRLSAATDLPAAHARALQARFFAVARNSKRALPRWRCREIELIRACGRTIACSLCSSASTPMSCRRSPSGAGRAAAAGTGAAAEEEEAAGRAADADGAHTRAHSSATPTRGRRERIAREKSKAQMKGAAKGSKGGQWACGTQERGGAGSGNTRKKSQRTTDQKRTQTD